MAGGVPQTILRRYLQDPIQSLQLGGSYQAVLIRASTARRLTDVSLVDVAGVETKSGHSDDLALQTEQ